MKHFEDSVRAAVEELAATAPPPGDLASVARNRGRRIRRRRRAVAGLAAVALVGSVLTPYAIMEDRRSAPRPVPVAPTPSPSVTSPQPAAKVPYVAAAGKKWWTEPIALPGGLVVTAVSGKWTSEQRPADTLAQGSVVLNRATGRYQVFPGGYTMFDAAPAGRYVLVQDDSSARIGIANAATGQVRMLDHGSGSGVEWSSDGKKLLLTLNAGGFRIIDAATGSAEDHTIPESTALCPDNCFFTWLPGGKQVAIAERDPAVKQSEDREDTVQKVVVYDAATGARLRELPLPGVPAGTGAWSPDGKHVLLMPDATEPGGVRITEVATGRVLGTIGSQQRMPVRFVENSTVLAVGGRDLYLHDLNGVLKAKLNLPADFIGRDISLGRG
ncbi:WD40 repeat domain-containing protein [Actinoplanes sp. NPDC051861]|uniref:WD40 repeat domain-containing protein n=1 Tax=Actinoplanes sp. NPDC051861 TaxID=3155170 RepID=UPI003434B15C